MERKKRRRPKDNLLTFERGDLDTRAPLLYIVSNSAWSRRPIQLDWPGAAMRASICGRVKYPTSFLSSRLMGIAKTGATIATLRMLRPQSGKTCQGGQADVTGADGVASLLLQVVEKGEEGRGVQVGHGEGRGLDARGLFDKGQQQAERVAATATVWGLARLWRQRWSVKKAWIWGARGTGLRSMTPHLWLHSAETWQPQRSEVLGGTQVPVGVLRTDVSEIHREGG